LAILCCRNFAQEVGAGVTAEGWDDVVVVPFPARCGRPPLAWDEVCTLLPAECDAVAVLGRACVGELGEPPSGLPPVRIVPVKQCFHLVAAEQLVDEAIAAGSYLLTPAWLADWRGQLQTLGFDPDGAAELFGEFAKELLFLDTGVAAGSATQLAELQVALKLPVRRLGVGLDSIRARLVRLVLEWRLDLARRAHARELADHVAAMDMLVQLAKTQQENEAITCIEELFRMLFAPAALLYLRVDNAVVLPASNSDPDSARLQRALQALADGESHAWTADGQGFLLRIGQGAATLGLIAVDRLAFPAYRERYLNMALAISGVCGLAIENARNRQRLLEAEKMASLGIVVAGVAHEINTPLAVGLTATSTLQLQSRTLAERFAARSMTQSDLDHFLQHATEALLLIRSNLERIGQLTDAFRQVAVGGQGPDRQRFPLRDCIDQVVESFGERAVAAHVSFTIDCDPRLEIDSVAGDWTSIFLNLIGNSLKHGFKGRDQGRIEIHVNNDQQQLQIHYRDDGIGMDPATLAHVFDPFFTTDLQHGMGLGMHLVYNLVTHRLGGSIRCNSTPGAGVHFEIDIPR
jgi:signal transduction histidine kinase